MSLDLANMEAEDFAQLDDETASKLVKESGIELTTEDIIKSHSDANNKDSNQNNQSNQTNPMQILMG